MQGNHIQQPPANLREDFSDLELMKEKQPISVIVGCLGKDGKIRMSCSNWLNARFVVAYDEEEFEAFLKEGLFTKNLSPKRPKEMR